MFADQLGHLTYARWFVQLGLPLSQSYREEALASNPSAAAHLSGLFEARFDPSLKAADRSRREARHRRPLQGILAGITRLDDDRIVRAFLAAVSATLRTSYYRANPDGSPRPYLSVKIHTREVPDAPLPRPMFEIFMHSSRVEGVHLRMGRVARGGIRWSDRREDFRTEILGLMKAQNVKNTVIVPVGSKGGFVPRRLPAAREEAQREGTECYRLFIRSLLDLTDNLVDGKVVPPPGVVRAEPDDPYLVVAADKGTASFSDLANEISAEYGFWLGDTFASGGSNGYDHKKHAITARGARECARHHFAELGIGPERDCWMKWPICVHSLSPILHRVSGMAAGMPPSFSSAAWRKITCGRTWASAHVPMSEAILTMCFRRWSPGTPRT